MTFIFKTPILYYFLAIILLVFTDCSSSESKNIRNKADNDVDTLVQINNNTTSSKNSDDGLFRMETYNNQEVIATYQSASMYAAATHYHFETEEGQEILVVESIDAETPVKLPKNMLEEFEFDEGPPEGNPEFIGNLFKLYFNDKGDVYKIISYK